MEQDRVVHQKADSPMVSQVLTQDDLAEKLGIDIKTYSRYKNSQH